jgi:hypothetical protein
MIYDYDKAKKQWEPVRFYWDGLKLWGIYAEGFNYRKKALKRKYTKGPVDYTESNKREPFKSYHSTISKDKAEELYPEYFI